MGNGTVLQDIARLRFVGKNVNVNRYQLRLLILRPLFLTICIFFLKSAFQIG